MEEIREIPGFPNYGISKDGRVWSKKERNMVHENYREIPLKTRVKRRYLSVKLQKMGVRSGSDYAVHRLLYLAWIGPIPYGFQIDHIDGDRSNNSIDNLEAVSPSENTKRAYRNKLIPSRVGDANPNSIARRPNREAA